MSEVAVVIERIAALAASGKTDPVRALAAIRTECVEAVAAAMRDAAVWEGRVREVARRLKELESQVDAAERLANALVEAVSGLDRES